MNREELIQEANNLSLKHWGVPYTGEIKLIKTIWVCKNAHFETMRSDPSHQVIVMSIARNSQRSREEILGTLLHELVHWRLHNLGLPANDTDQEFVEEAIRVGAPISLNASAQEAYKKYGFPRGQMELFKREYLCTWVKPEDDRAGY